MKYKWRTRPYAHQVQAVKFALRRFRDGAEGVAFLMEPRTGKTKTTIDTVSILHKMHGLRKVVIVAPNRVLGTWVDEISMHCPLVYHITVWDAAARQMPPPKTSGSFDIQFLIVNYEAFNRPGKKLASGRRSVASGRFKNRQHILRWLGGERGACVLDEGHKVKSPTAKQSTMLISMRGMFAWRFLLTGTPVTKAKRAHDIFMQWQWVNADRFPWGQTVETFRNHTGRWIASNGFPQWVGPRPDGLDDMRRGIHEDSVVVFRADCLDLPPRNPDRLIRVKLGPSGKHYDEMAKNMVTKLHNGIIAEASIPLVVTLRLSQLTSGFVGVPEIREVRGKSKLVSVPHRVGFEKLTALEELLTEETVERDEKVVIAARFVSDLNAIEALCDQLKLKRWSIRGGIKREDSDRAIREFRRHDEAGVMIVQPAAASLGIDLRTAAHMIWYSLTQSWVDYSQCCDRIALSPVATTFTFLLGEGTVDELAYRALQEDGDMSRLILTHPEALLRR